MISFTVRMRFDPKEVDGIRANLEALTVASRKEPGCVNYVEHAIGGLYQGMKDRYVENLQAVA
jgi:quinol monooxygenase YgiN